MGRHESLAALFVGGGAAFLLARACYRSRRAKWLAAVRITRGTAADSQLRISSLIPLVQECFPEIAEEAARGDDVFALLCGFYEPENCIALFADDDDGLCGLALLFPIRSARESSLYISTVCVSGSCRRRGLGGRLMRAASSLAAAEGLGRLAGTVRTTETARLLPFYEGLGATVRDDASRAGGGATVFTLRLEAPSGEPTSRGASLPASFFPPDGPSVQSAEALASQTKL